MTLECLSSDFDFVIVIATQQCQSCFHTIKFQFYDTLENEQPMGMQKNHKEKDSGNHPCGQSLDHLFKNRKIGTENS